MLDDIDDNDDHHHHNNDNDFVLAPQEGLIDGMKQEEGHEEVDETGALISSRRVRKGSKRGYLQLVYFYSSH